MSDYLLDWQRGMKKNGSCTSLVERNIKPIEEQLGKGILDKRSAIFPLRCQVHVILAVRVTHADPVDLTLQLHITHIITVLLSVDTTGFSDCVPLFVISTY